MKRNIKIISGLCAVIMLFTIFSTFSASSASDEGFSLNNGDKAYAIYLYDLTGGFSLYEKNVDKSISPASTVKMMTALVALEAFRDLNDKITITNKMIDGMETNVLGLSVGEIVTVKSLLVALVCGGYNDAAQALAVASAGSVEDFVALMNEKAVKLGAINTLYTEPTGIDDSAQTTAQDTMLIAAAFMESDILSEFSSLPSYKLPATNKAKEKIIYNRNALISSYTGSKYLNSQAIGMNAGMTSGGGYCVVTGINNGGREYICVVMGAKHGADTNTTYSYVIANELIAQISKFGQRELLSSAEKVGALPIEGASLDKNEVIVVPAKDISAYLPEGYDTSDLLEYSYVYNTDEVVAPVKKGDVVGKVVVSYDGEIVGISDLIIGEDVEREPVTYALYLIRSFIVSRTFVLIVISFVLLTFAKLIFIDRNKRRKSRYTRRY